MRILVVLILALALSGCIGGHVTSTPREADNATAGPDGSAAEGLDEAPPWAVKEDAGDDAGGKDAASDGKDPGVKPGTTGSGSTDPKDSGDAGDGSGDDPPDPAGDGEDPGDELPTEGASGAGDVLTEGGDAVGDAVTDAASGGSKDPVGDAVGDAGGLLP